MEFADDTKAGVCLPLIILLPGAAAPKEHYFAAGAAQASWGYAVAVASQLRSAANTQLQSLLAGAWAVLAKEGSCA